MKQAISILIYLFISLLFNRDALSQSQITLEGEIFNADTDRRIDAATLVVVKLKKKIRASADGSYKVTFPAPGEYTIFIRAFGFKTKIITLNIIRDLKRDFKLEVAKIRGSALVVRVNRDYQRVSRMVMKNKELKIVAGSYGDSLSAINSMPGIIRSTNLTGMRGGPFGHLVIRGARHFSNRYFVDDVPLLFPQHGGFQHATISSEITDEIVLYSSSAPAEYGEITGAIIEFKTINNIPKLTGNVNLSFIGFNAFWGGPITKTKKESSGTNTINTTTLQKNDTFGHWAVAGRVAFWSFWLPIVLKNPSNWPKYYDYQAKGEYFMDDKAHHSIGVLIFGNFDTFDSRNKNTDEFEKKQIETEGADPMMTGTNIDVEYHSHSQSVFYNFSPSSRFSHRLVVFNAISKTISKISYPLVSTTNVDVVARPGIIGAKDKLRWEILPTLMEVRFGVDYNYYLMKGHGSYPALINPVNSIKDIDYGDPSLFQLESFDTKESNTVIGGYIEDKITFRGLTLLPGLRLDYLNRTGTTVYDPRGLASFEFTTETIFSVAGGIYHAFPQTNSLLFLDNSNKQAVAYDSDLKPEKSYQRSISIEQKIQPILVRIEYFYNDFYNLIEDNLQDTGDFPFRSTGTAKSKGFEFYLKRTRVPITGLYGWLSYTYTQVRHKTGITGVPEGDKYLPASWEQKHAVKITVGFRIKSGSRFHDISLRFELASGFPYTPITGSTQTAPNRYIPVYGETNSKQNAMAHRLDIKYSNIMPKSWGQIKWYIEVINIYNHKPLDVNKWRYDQPYSDNNPHFVSNPNNFDLIPFGGFEITF